MLKLASLSLLLSTLVAAQDAELADIVNFTPLTDVRDQNRIDLDLQKMMEQLDLLTEDGFAVAKAIYETGAFSKTISTLVVSGGLYGGLMADIPQGTRMVGIANPSDSDGSVWAQQNAGVLVFAYDGGAAGDAELIVQYVNEGCYVGANPDPVTSGCLTPEGTLEASDGSGLNVSYTYSVLNDTANAYNIQLFTQGSEYSFEFSPLTDDFQLFADYYGSDTYVDDIIQAAFAGSSTSFSTGKDLDMSAYDFEPRAEIAAKASAYMAVWMYVVRELEHAIYLCNNGGCDEYSCLGKPAVHEVDEAVAFYAGSLEGTDGSGDGVLTYYLANRRAADFKTAGEAGDAVEGTAKVNLDLLAEFKTMSEAIVAAECDAGETSKDRIVELMKIPLIQGTIRYAYLIAEGIETTDTVKAEGAIFAASVLPFVNTCSADDADIIYNNLKTGADTVDFVAVKEAFERNYACMGVAAADVGGLWDADNNAYYEGAAPPATDAGVVADSGSASDSTTSTDTEGEATTSTDTEGEAGLSTVVSFIGNHFESKAPIISRLFLPIILSMFAFEMNC